MTTRILLVVAYDGAGWSGFARQDNAPTIAGELEAVLSRIDPNASNVTAASRTDAGVHARHQMVSFSTEREIANRGWVLAFAQHLPPSISVLSAARVPLDFDPRRDPLWKRYRYLVLQSVIEDPFLVQRCWRVHQPLDLELMRAEAAVLEGEHDFAAFRSVKDPRPDTIRQLHHVRVETAITDPRVLEISVQGNRFMYNMVRIIVGSLVDVARKRRSPGSLKAALISGRREDLGMTAPAEGLYLEHIELATCIAECWPVDPKPEQ